MGNDQLLSAYNMQAAVCDEYIAVIDVKPYASDQDCFVPLMEKFKEIYGHYPKCPNGKKFIFKCNRHVKRNRYGRTL